MRRDIANIVNELAGAVPEYARIHVDTIRMYWMIFGYCKAHKCNPRSNSYELNNGLFSINGECTERVHPLPVKIMDCLEGAHWEGRILARQYEEV